MKRLFLSLTTICFLFVCAPPSCETITKITQAKTSESTTNQIIIRSEQLVTQAALSFDVFVSLERNNESLLKKLNPGINATANEVRKNGQKYCNDALDAVETFKKERTSANEANLLTAYKTVKALYDKVKANMAEANKLSDRTP